MIAKKSIHGSCGWANPSLFHSSTKESMSEHASRRKGPGGAQSCPDQDQDKRAKWRGAQGWMRHSSCFSPISHGIRRRRDVSRRLTCESGRQPPCGVPREAQWHLERRCSFAVLACSHTFGQCSTHSGQKVLASRLPWPNLVVTYDSEQLDQLKLSVSILVIELRLPIVALIQHLVATGGPGPSSVFVGHAEAEAGASDDGVDMRADLVGKYDGVGALRCQTAALHDE